MKEIEEVYVKRKKSQPEQVPKYLKITKIDMRYPTFRKVLMCPKIISEKEMNSFIENDQKHNENREYLT